MTRLALAILLTSCAPAIAATTAERGYVPGGAACDGACSDEWARVEAGIAEGAIPHGPPQLIRLPIGTRLAWMSHAEDGRPRGGPSNLTLVAAPANYDRPGYDPETRTWTVRGWYLPDGSIWGEIEACQNMARATLPEFGDLIADEWLSGDAPSAWSVRAPAAVDSIFHPRAPVAAAGGAGGFGFGGWSGGGDHDHATPPPPRPAPPAPVPAPAPIVLIASAMAALGLIRRR